MMEVGPVEPEPLSGGWPDPDPGVRKVGIDGGLEMAIIADTRHSGNYPDSQEAFPSRGGNAGNK
jgi:hypothetical protein